jgi:hypothetical protein
MPRSVDKIPLTKSMEKPPLKKRNAYADAFVWEYLHSSS